MNAIKVLSKEPTTERFHVPTITNTTPVRAEKEIDLSFWQMIERDRRAKEYIQTVEKQSKRNAKEIILGILAGTCMIAFTVGFFVIGLFF